MEKTTKCFSNPSSLLAFAAWFTAVLLSSCAADFASIQPGLEERGHYIRGVPFYRQSDNNCGPAALAGVTSFWGALARDELTADVYPIQLRGSLPADIELYLKGAGFETVSMTGSMKSLTDQVRQNIPVISLLDIGFSSYRIPHYVTVIGFDDVNKVLILHDGITPNKVIAYDSFVRYWSRAGSWMLVAIPQSVKRPS